MFEADVGVCTRIWFQFVYGAVIKVLGIMGCALVMNIFVFIVVVVKCKKCTRRQ